MQTHARRGPDPCRVSKQAVYNVVSLGGVDIRRANTDKSTLFAVDLLT